MRLELPVAQYADDAARGRFGRQLEERLQALPRVKSVTLWGPSMLGRARNAYIAYPEGAPADDPNGRLLMDRHGVNPGALANVSNIIQDFLFGVSPSDPAIYAAVAALLIVLALLACWIPAYRATRVDPTASLRGESW